MAAGASGRGPVDEDMDEDVPLDVLKAARMGRQEKERGKDAPYKVANHENPAAPYARATRSECIVASFLHTV